MLAIRWCARLTAAPLNQAKHIPKIPGCTPKERAAFGELLTGEGGFVDTFRSFHPDATGAFTYWSTKAMTARPEGKGELYGEGGGGHAV